MKSSQDPEDRISFIDLDALPSDPTVSQIIIKTIACVVCHSDVYIH